MSVTAFINTGYTPILAGLLEKCLDAHNPQRLLNWRRSAALPVVATGPLAVSNQREQRSLERSCAVDSPRESCRRAN